jgi:CBS domain containing-hemolysin-like protein
MVKRGVRHAKALEMLVKRLDEVVTAILLANNFFNTAISSMGTALFLTWLGPQWGVPVATLILGTIILLFGEVVPKTFAIRYADRVGLWVAPLMQQMTRILNPVVRLFVAMTNRIMRTMGLEMKPRSPLITEEEIKIMIELGKEQGVLGEDERQMLHRIFEFGDLRVADVMIPKDRMVVVDEKSGHEAILTILTEEGHSRIPVYRDTPDRIVGVIYAQEMLHIWREGRLIVLADLIHPIYQVRPEKRVIDLLRDFQRLKIQIAVVTDPDGRALGLVTLEDLIEEIVGEVEEGGIDSFGRS